MLISLKPCLFTCPKSVNRARVLVTQMHIVHGIVRAPRAIVEVDAFPGRMMGSHRSATAVVCDPVLSAEVNVSRNIFVGDSLTGTRSPGGCQ